MGSPTLWRVYAASKDALPAPSLAEHLSGRNFNRIDRQGGAFTPVILGLIDEHLRAGYAPGGIFLLFVGGKRAHFASLIPWTEPRSPGMRLGEAEMCTCYTEPEFRSAGIYPAIVRFLATEAGRQDIRRIYMKTGADNCPSRRGIPNAGLHYLGRRLSFGFSAVVPAAN